MKNNLYKTPETNDTKVMDELHMKHWISQTKETYLILLCSHLNVTYTSLGHD